MERVLTRFVIALGNPGPSYAFTRHNVAWMFVDWVVSPQNFARETPHALIARAHGFIWIKPLTWMNRSGDVIPELTEVFPEWTARETLVVYDDVALPAGRARLRLRGSDGGHRGMASIIAQVGEDIPRLRIGIGPRPSTTPLRDFVLETFQEEELALIMAQFPRWYEGIQLLRDGDVAQALQLVNTPPSENASPPSPSSKGEIPQKGGSNS